MSDLFEKRKRMEYLLNTLSNKTFVREHFNGVCGWLSDKGNLYLPAFKIPETESGGDDFPFGKRRFAKNEMSAAIAGYTAALRDKVRSARRRVPGPFERNLIFVQRLLGLSDLEKEYLGLLVRLECDDETGNIMSEMDSPRCRVNLSEAAIMAGVSRDKAARMSRRDSVLARLGLIDVDCRGAPEASDVAKTFYNTPFESADDVRRFLIGTPVKATLGMTDFAHLPQAEIMKKTAGFVAERSRGWNQHFAVRRTGDGKDGIRQNAGAKRFRPAVFAGRKRRFRRRTRIRQPFLPAGARAKNFGRRQRRRFAAPAVPDPRRFRRRQGKSRVFRLPERQGAPDRHAGNRTEKQSARQT